MKLNRKTALAISILLHAGVLGAGLVAWPWARGTRVVQVTPVTLLSADDFQPLRAAEESPTPQEAMIEDPVDGAPIESPAEEPAPQPKAAPATPPRPKAPPAAKAEPKAAPKQVASKAPASKAPLNLDDLAESLSKSSGSRNTSGSSSARQGPSQFEKDLASRLADGSARAASNDALSRIADKLERLWQHNCGASGADQVRVRVRFSLSESGSLVGQPSLVDHRDVSAISDPVLQAAATRALNAVARGSPYEGLPREDYGFWRTVTVNFDGRSACSRN